MGSGVVQGWSSGSTLQGTLVWRWTDSSPHTSNPASWSQGSSRASSSPPHARGPPGVTGRSVHSTGAPLLLPTSLSLAVSPALLVGWPVLPLVELVEPVAFVELAEGSPLEPPAASVTSVDDLSGPQAAAASMSQGAARWKYRRAHITMRLNTSIVGAAPMARRHKLRE